MIYIYYIGGPWDLHKVTVQEQPSINRPLIVREMLPSNFPNELKFTDHEYIVKPVGKDVFVAISGRLMR